MEEERHSVTRWLLSLTELDTDICDEWDYTPLHSACYRGAPLDIVIALTKRSSWETVNKRDSEGVTPLDLAVGYECPQYRTPPFLAGGGV